MGNGTLPLDIDEIITKSLETIDVYTLWIWFKMRKVLFKLNNRGPYRALTVDETRELITDAIKQFYYDQYDVPKYIFGDSMIADVGVEHSGVHLIIRDSFFEIDFFILAHTEDLHLEEISFKEELLNYSKKN